MVHKRSVLRSGCGNNVSICGNFVDSIFLWEENFLFHIAEGNLKKSFFKRDPFYAKLPIYNDRCMFSKFALKPYMAFYDW